MPCRDYQSDWGNNNYADKEKIDKLAAMLCTACRCIENSEKGIDSILEYKYGERVFQWWERHKESDRLAAIELQKTLEREKAFNKMIKKLSSAEIDIINDLAGHSIL